MADDLFLRAAKRGEAEHRIEQAERVTGESIVASRDVGGNGHLNSGWFRQGRDSRGVALASPLQIARFTTSPAWRRIPALPRAVIWITFAASNAMIECVKHARGIGGLFR